MSRRLTEFKAETIHGKKVSFGVDETGAFVASILDDGGQEERVCTAALFEECRRRATAKLKTASARLAVRFFDTEKMKHSTVTGVHARTGNWLVTTDGEKGSEQAYYYSIDHNAIAPLDAADLNERTALRAATDKAKKAEEEFDKRHSFSVQGAVQKALAKAEVAS